MAKRGGILLGASFLIIGMLLVATGSLAHAGSISSPTSLAVVADGDAIDTKLQGANDLSLVTIGSRTYALVISNNEHAVQIIDVTDPRSPSRVSVASDGRDGFDELAGASGITTASFNSRTYAIAVSETDDGLQIINITDPANPSATASITDTSTLELNGVISVDAFTIGSNHYVIAVSSVDDGIQIIDITNPASPVATASAADGDSGFGALNGAYDVEVFARGSFTYAAVASDTDNAVQIINLTDPSSPAGVAEARDGQGGFVELDGANGVTTISNSSHTLALVAASVDNGLQIIDVTNPASPSPVAAVTDGSGGFTELEFAWDVTTVAIGSNTYALVASDSDDGVQIINITDPAYPTATAAIQDAQGGFDHLDAPRDVATMVYDSRTYAIIASNGDDAIQIADITDPASPSPVAAVRDISGTFAELDEPIDVVTFEIGTRLYAAVAAFEDDGVQILDVTDPASPLPVSSVSDGSGGFTELDGSHSITSFSIGSRTYLAVAAFEDDGVQIIDVTNPASPAATAAISDNSTYPELAGASGIDTFEAGSRTYVIVTGQNDDGVQIIDVTNPASPSAAGVLVDNNTLALDNPVYVATEVIGDRIYALVADRIEHAVQIIDVTDPDSPVATAAMRDGQGGFDELQGPDGITTTVIGSKTYALVAGQGDSGVQIADISDPNNPVATASVTNGQGGFTALGGATDIEVIFDGSNTYAFVVAYNTRGVQVMNITNPASPSPVTALLSDRSSSPGSFTGLDQPSSVAFAVIGGRTFAIVTDAVGDQLQFLDLGTLALRTPNSPRDDIIGFISEPAPSGALTDGTNIQTKLNGARTVEHVRIGDSLYALVASIDSDAVQIMDVTDPRHPKLVSSVSHDSTFTEMDDPYDIAVARIGSSTYALVAADADDGVQIIDISDPARPAAVAAIESNSTYAVSSPRAVEVAAIGSSTYALVAGYTSDAIQIIDITDPASPSATARATDGSTFARLNGPTDIEIFYQGTKTFAIVAAQVDNGVQVIEITSPSSPASIGSVSDGSTFTELAGASDISLVDIGSKTYALVASYTDDGLQIIDITQTFNMRSIAAITDGSTYTALDGAYGVDTFDIASRTYAAVTGYEDDGLQIIDITNPASPAAVVSISDNEGGFTELDGAAGVHIITRGSNVYALVASIIDDGIQVIDVTNPASPAAVAGLTHALAPFDSLDRPFGLDTVTIGSSTYALVGSFNDDTLTVVDISAPNVPVGAATYGDSTNLDGITHVAAFAQGSKTYALVGSYVAGKAEVMNITNPNSLASVGRTPSLGGGNSGVWASDFFTIGDDMFAAVAVNRDHAVHIVSVTNPAAPVVVSVARTGTPQDTSFPNSILTEVIGERTYAFVSSYTRHGIQIIDLTNPSSPVSIANITDGQGGFDTLGNAGEIASFTQGGKTYVLVTSQRDDGIQIIDVTDPRNPVATANATHNKGGFTGLDAVYGIDIVANATHTFAIATGYQSNTVQIIDVTDPSSPSPVAVVTDGQGGFTEIQSGYRLETVTVAGSTYAVVIGEIDDGLQLINLNYEPPPPPPPPPVYYEDNAPLKNTIDNRTANLGFTDPFDIRQIAPVAAITNGQNGGTELAGARDIAIAAFGTRAYALVTGYDDDAISIMDVTDPRFVSPVSIIQNGTAFPKMDGVSGLATVSVGTSSYALVASEEEDAVSIIDITNPSSPTLAASVTDGSDGFVELDGARDVATAVIEGRTYALVTGYEDDGVQIIEITRPARPVATASIADNSTLALDGASGIATAAFAGSTYAFVAGYEDDGIQMIDITDPSSPVAVASATDGVDGFDELDGASDITTIFLGARAYALVAAEEDDGLQIIDVTRPAHPVATASVSDDSTLALGNASGVATVSIDRRPHAVVTGFEDDGVQIIDITDPASPAARCPAVTDGKRRVYNA